MHIEHVAAYCWNLETVKEFFVRYFDAQCGALYHNPATEFSSYFLTFADGARLELMHKPGLADAGTQNHMGLIHIAFGAGSKEGVDSLTARLKADGFAVISGPRQTGDGYYESCILGPEGNIIEITV